MIKKFKYTNLLIATTLGLLVTSNAFAQAYIWIDKATKRKHFSDIPPNPDTVESFIKPKGTPAPKANKKNITPAQNIAEQKLREKEQQILEEQKQMLKDGKPLSEVVPVLAEKTKKPLTPAEQKMEKEKKAKEKEAQEKKLKEEQATKQAKAKEEQERIKYCQDLQSQLDSFKQGQPAKTFNQKTKEYEYLDDAQRLKSMDDLKKKQQENCKQKK